MVTVVGAGIVNEDSDHLEQQDRDWDAFQHAFDEPLVVDAKQQVDDPQEVVDGDEKVPRNGHSIARGV